MVWGEWEDHVVEFRGSRGVGEQWVSVVSEMEGQCRCWEGDDSLMNLGPACDEFLRFDRRCSISEVGKRSWLLECLSTTWDRSVMGASGRL